MDTLGIFGTNAGEYPESLSFSKLQTNILITLYQPCKEAFIATVFEEDCFFPLQSTLRTLKIQNSPMNCNLSFAMQFLLQVFLRVLSCRKYFEGIKRHG